MSSQGTPRHKGGPCNDPVRMPDKRISRPGRNAYFGLGRQVGVGREELQDVLRGHIPKHHILLQLPHLKGGAKHPGHLHNTML